MGGYEIKSTAVMPTNLKGDRQHEKETTAPLLQYRRSMRSLTKLSRSTQLQNSQFSVTALPLLKPKLCDRSLSQRTSSDHFVVFFKITT